MKSTQKIVEEQVQRWQLSRKEKVVDVPGRSVITVSREPGSGGRLIAAQLAEELGFDIFHQEVIHQMAESAKLNSRLFETVDEKGMSVIEEAISAAILEHHIWPDEYLKHLMKVLGVIGKHGRAVVVGRGTNFILPADKCLRVRVIAAMGVRVRRLCKEFGLSPKRPSDG